MKKILIIVLIALAAILAAIFVLPLFVNGVYHVEREVSVDQPREMVFDYLKYLKNQDNFSVWAKMDPAMKKEFVGTDGEVGFISKWESETNEDVGKGEQEIMKITPGERIDYELRFQKPFEATDNAYMITEATGENTTTVKWGFDGEMDYPMKGMMLFMNMDEMLGPQLEEGLQNLKEILDALPPPVMESDTLGILEEEAVL